MWLDDDRGAMKLAVDASKSWWSQVKEREGAPNADETAYKTAAKAYEEECARFDASRDDMSASDKAWFEQILASGTAPDRVSALQIAAKDAPVYGLRWLARLLVLASEQSRHASYPALEALVTCVSASLPPSRDLVPFVRSGATSSSSRRALVLAYYEDGLASVLDSLLRLLSVALHDQVQHGRERAMRLALSLLTTPVKDSSALPAARREALLAMLANKLGDPSRKVASRAAFYLQLVVDADASLSVAVAQAVQRETLRPDAANDKPAYYGLTFLSQLRLRKDDPGTTDVVLAAYQHHVEAFLTDIGGKKKGRKDSDSDEIPRTVKVALTGIARAVPFVDDKAALDAFATRLVACAGRIRCYSTLLQAAALVHSVFVQRPETMSMLGNMLRSHILDVTRLADATASHAMAAKLVLRACRALISSDAPSSLPELRALLKSMLSVSLVIASPAFALASLAIVSEAMLARPSLRMLLSFPDDAVNDGSSELLWEIVVLARHCDASVRAHARALISGSTAVLDEDPFVTKTPLALLQAVMDNRL